MVSQPDEPEKIERDMRPRRGKKTIITIGAVTVEITPVGVDGHDGWKVEMPAGGRIGHVSLPSDTPRQT